MSKVREDILSITEEKLVQIANMGLVKRAKKAIGKGDMPTFQLADDQTLTISFADENTLTWQLNQGLADTQCTCPASMCRHRVQSVIAYRQLHDNPEVTITSPHTITPEHLQDFANASLIKLANKLCQHGMSVRLQPNTEENADKTETNKGKCPSAQLPMATVRFWGGATLHEATCDCIQKQGCEHILLAGCAYALFDDEPTSVTTVQLSKDRIVSLLHSDRAQPAPHHSLENSEINPDNPSSESTAQPYVKVDSAQHLTDAEMSLFSELLQHGITAGAMRYARQLDDVRTELNQTKAVWLLSILDDLMDWLEAYENRRSDFEPLQGLHLVAEYVLRTLARKNNTYHAGALGIGIKQETAIATARLTSLGCRVNKQDDTFTAQTMLIDHKSATFMLYKHQWQVSQDSQNHAAQPDSPEQRARKTANQRISGRINLAQLASGQLTCQRAKRMANHEIKLNRSRAAYNQVLPQQANWAELESSVCYNNIDKLISDIKSRPVSVLSGRYSQPNFMVVRIHRIIEHGYNPATQSYVVIAQDEKDNTFTIKRQHRAHVPFAVESMAQAFANVTVDDELDACFVAGEVNISTGMLLVTPWAVVTDTLYVPDTYLPSKQAHSPSQNGSDEAQENAPSALSTCPVTNFHMPDKSQDALTSSLQKLQDMLTHIIHLGVDNHKIENIKQLYHILETQGFSDLAKLILKLDVQESTTLPSNLLQLFSENHLYLQT